MPVYFLKMKKNLKTFAYYITLLVLALSCTKDVGLVTEVEFELTEQHQERGAVNESLATTVTVVPEADLEGYTYYFSYTVSQGEGFYLNKNGAILPQGEKIALNPLSATLQYKGSSKGEHVVQIKATDSFGFAKEVSLNYTLNEVFVTWTATSPDSKLQLGTKTAITITLGDEAKEVTTYERNYKITTGSGAFTTRPGGEVVTMNNYIPILPGSHLYTFVPDALGNVILEFDLKNTKGQQLTTSINFEVVAQTLSDQNDITGFTIPGQLSVAPIIDTENHTITVNVSSETDLNVAPTSLTISTGASIAPLISDIQDFSTPVTYIVTAENGNVQEWTIQVNANSTTDTTKPIIIRTGANPQNVTLGGAYTELGATASDDIDGDITANITITGTVNINTVGDYPITYTVSDAAGNTADPVIRVVTVSPASNQNPLANDDTFTVVENSSNNPFDVLNNDSDLDGNTLSISSTTNPLNGTVTIVGGGNDALLYTPNPNFTGTDQFEYTLSDGNGGAATATVTINVNTNQAPTAVATSDVISGLAPLTVSFDNQTSSDSDGTIVLSNWNFGDGSAGNTAGFPHVATYTFNTPGTYIVTLTVTDNDDAIGTTTITITVNGGTATFSNGRTPIASGTLTIANSAVIFSVNATGDLSIFGDNDDTYITFTINGVGSWEAAAPPDGTASTNTPSIPPGTYTYIISIGGDTDGSGSVSGGQ